MGRRARSKVRVKTWKGSMERTEMDLRGESRGIGVEDKGGKRTPPLFAL